MPDDMELPAQLRELVASDLQPVRPLNKPWVRATAALPFAVLLLFAAPALPLIDVRTMDELLAGVQSSTRFTTLLVSLFAMLALFLAAVGIYGTQSHAVASRRREIGIRLALGASRSNVLAMIGREGLTVCAVGLGLGVPLAVASTQMMRPLLYEISPMDPLRLTAALLVVAATAMLACIIPAYRAATVMPLAALRR